MGGVGGGVFWRLQHRSEREIAAFAVLYRAGKIVPADAASLQSVLDRFPKTAAADVTRLKIAAVTLQQGTAQQAIEALTPLAEGSGGPAVLHLLAREMLAAAYEERKDFVRAAEAFRALVGDPTYYDRLRALKGAVRCLIAAGKSDDARAMLAEAKLPKDVEQAIEEERLWLVVKEVKQ